MDPSNQPTNLRKSTISGVSRREFVRGALASALTVTIVPRHVLGGGGFSPPSETVNLGGIGAGGMGGADIRQCAKLGANIVTLCDVDDARASGSYEAFPRATRYKDFRVMLEKEAKSIDAVTVGTPDHIHGIASLNAMRIGKHVYCEKPLTRTIAECRKMAEYAKKYGVATQMGNQGHAKEGARVTNEWIQAGVIGEVREVHVWTNRAGDYWPQGLPYPTKTDPVPAGFDWELWQGASKTLRSFSSLYAPHDWRGWFDYGTGALGDMGCHIIDHPFWALHLGMPTRVRATTSLYGTQEKGKPLNQASFPHTSIVYYEFPARGALPPVEMTWYDGGLQPPKPKEMPANEDMPKNGALYIGSRGKLIHGSHGGMPRLIVGSEEEARNVPKTIPRSIGHHAEWLAACKGDKPPISDFEYAAAMTEVVLLGVLAARAPGKTLEWDPRTMSVSNMPDLDEFVHPHYRAGWPA